MPNEIYNEGRVVGYSAYELFVKTYLSEGGDPTKVPTEREWLASSLAMGASMIVKVSGESVLTHGHIDIPFPSNTKLQAANVIIGSFFDGDAEFDGAWATKVTDYGTGISNTNVSSPSGTYLQSSFWQLPYSTYSNEDATSVSLRTKRLHNYLRITDGVILMPGNYVRDTSNTPPSDLIPNLNDYPVLRLRVESDTSIETFHSNAEPRILLTGFTLSSVLFGLVGLDGSTDTSSNIPQDGGFNGPAIFPWASKVILTIPNSYMRKYGIAYRVVGDEFENPYKVSKNAPFIDIDANLQTIYSSTSSSVYAPYSYTTPSNPSRVNAVYDYYSTPTKETATFMVYQSDSNYPPALYANNLGRIDSYSSEYLYPIDVVAPGTVKMFKSGDNTTMKTYETTFTGTTALNISSSGILSMTGASGLFNLNNIVAKDASVTVTRNSTTGAWEIAADATGQIAITSTYPSVLKIDSSTSGGVKTFTFTENIKKKDNTSGLSITSSNGVTQIENTLKINSTGTFISATQSGDTYTINNTMNIKPGDGISVNTSGNDVTITNSRPAISTSDLTNLDYTGYRVYFANATKYLLQDGTTDTYTSSTGYYTGVNRFDGNSNYNWKDHIINGSYSDTAHREKTGFRYATSMSGNEPTAITIRFTDSVSVDAGDNNYIPNAYNSSLQYSRYDYCSYNGKKWRCLSTTTGTFDSSKWREVTAVVLAYDTTLTYYKGDYCLANSKQWICKNETTGAFKQSDWYEDNTVLPTVSYGLCIADALSSGLSVDIPSYSDFNYTHGVGRNNAYTEKIGGTDYIYYPWDMGLVARICLTPDACKKMFFGSSDFTFSNNANVLIDGPTSGANVGEIINWVAYNGMNSSSTKLNETTRLRYPVFFRSWCRYPFIVENGEIMMATNSNINQVNNGHLIDAFGSAVSYNLKRDTSNKNLGDTGADSYHNFAMIFDITAETVADGINNQLSNLISYEGHPTSPYLIAAPSVHMNIDMQLRINYCKLT